MSYTIYVDTSVISCLSDPPHCNPTLRFCQQLTRVWWDNYRIPELSYCSAYQTDEIRHGDPLRAAMRLRNAAALVQLPQLSKAKQVIEFNAELLVCGGALTASARQSACHIACAAYFDIEVLVTWNCRDIANPGKSPLLRMLMDSQRQILPELVTPYQLMENDYENP